MRIVFLTIGLFLIFNSISWSQTKTIQLLDVSNEYPIPFVVTNDKQSFHQSNIDGYIRLELTVFVVRVC